MNIDLTAFSAELLSAQEIIPRARIIAQALTQVFPGAAVNVYAGGLHNGEEVWIPRAWSGEQSVRAGRLAIDEGTLGQAAKRRELLVFDSTEITREQYAHLDVRRTLRSLAYVPLERKGTLAGLVEILSFDSKVTIDKIRPLEAFAGISAAALATARNYEHERNESLSSITRLTQLYDLEKTFSSTLEMDELLPIIGDNSGKSWNAGRSTCGCCVATRAWR